ncbi:MAG TPA: hypothetical protein VEJ16_14845 [Alphaproteobacteria bacterium]|nr:hypothetical protein [Alphaproteobacteria bacterium]
MGVRWGFLVLLLIGLSHSAADAESITIKAFYGTYEGSGIAKNADSLYFGVTDRDIGVVIHPEGNGFSISWTTVLHAGGNVQNPKVKHRADKLSFVPVSGGTQPSRVAQWHATQMPDPMSGNPYAWARLEDTKLTVYMLTIDPDGRYEVQRYDRTLVAGGMELTFTDVRDGEPIRVVRGKLVKVGD